MRTIRRLFCLALLAASPLAHAEPLDSFQPAMVFTVKFGGAGAGFTTPKLDAQLQYAGGDRFGASHPAAVSWQVDGQGTALAFGGVPVYAANWQEDPSAEPRANLSSRGQLAITNGVTWTLIGGGAVLVVLNALANAVDEGVNDVAESVASMGTAGDGSSESSGDDGSGNSGRICVTTLCTGG